MRIGVDATCWHNRRGYGRHARALLRALVQLDTANHYTLFLDSTESSEPTPLGCAVRILRPSVPTVQAASANGHRSLADMWRMSRALSASTFDAILFPTIYSYVPVFSRARKLVMVHDVIAETYPHLTVPKRSARFFWQTKTALGRFQADALIAVSDYSREGIIRQFGLDPERVFVVGEAADPVFRKLECPVAGPKLQRFGLNGAGRLAVYMGGFSPHKNLLALISGFDRVIQRKEFADVRLVMTGATSNDAFHTYYDTVAAHVDALGLRDRVIFTGYLDDEDVVVLLNLASVLLLPSLMEGFGLPAVEAAACGCPVIATKASPLARLLGGGGLFVDTGEEDIACALETVLCSSVLRARMSADGLAAVGRLTWDQAARQMMAVIQKVQSS